jgi:hypothetical protein
MLVPSKVLDGIKEGRINLIFRRWKKLGVKAGGTQMTQRGVLAIDAVDIVSEKQVTDADAKAAGFESKTELLGQLFEREGEVTEIYRIAVHFAGEDPRKELRQKADLSDFEINDIIGKLRKLDVGSQRGNWTQLYLQMIHDQPNTHAAILAKQIGLDIPRFKPWVRKLKALGLTESLRPGYRLSPRGEKVLEALSKSDKN